MTARVPRMLHTVLLFAMLHLKLTTADKRTYGTGRE